METFALYKFLDEANQVVIDYGRCHDFNDIYKDYLDILNLDIPILGIPEGKGTVMHLRSHDARNIYLGDWDVLVKRTVLTNNTSEIEFIFSDSDSFTSNDPVWILRFTGTRLTEPFDDYLYSGQVKILVSPTVDFPRGILRQLFSVTVRTLNSPYIGIRWSRDYFSEMSECKGEYRELVFTADGVAD